MDYSELEFERSPIDIKRVLIADDHKLLCKAISRMLVLLDIHDIHVCYSGLDAIKCIPEFKPDLVITDVYMNPVSGVELLKAIRCGIYNLPRDLAVLMLTARPSHALIQLNVELDLDCFIAKPPIKNAIAEALNFCAQRFIPIRHQQYYKAINIEAIPGITADLDPDSYCESSVRPLKPVIAHNQDHKTAISRPRVAVGVAALDNDYREFSRLLERARTMSSERLKAADIQHLLNEVHTIINEHFSRQKEYILAYDEHPEQHIRSHEVLRGMIANLEMTHNAFKIESTLELVEILEALQLEHYESFDAPLNERLQRSLSSSSTDG